MPWRPLRTGKRIMRYSRSRIHSAGIVSENYDLLVEYDNYIVGEQIIRIDHALLGLEVQDGERYPYRVFAQTVTDAVQ